MIAEKNYRKRLEKVIELEDERLEPFHLQEIKKESNKEEEEDIEENIKKEKEEKTDKLKMKVTYNDGKMNFIRKQEVKDLKKKIKEVKNEAKEKIKKPKNLKGKYQNFYIVKKRKRIFKTKRGKRYKRFRRKN